HECIRLLEDSFMEMTASPHIVCCCCSLLLLLAASGWAQSLGLTFCQSGNDTLSSGQDLPTTLNASMKQPVKNAIGKDVAKACLDQLEQTARECNHFYVLEANQSAILQSEVCSENEKQLSQLIKSMHWKVALRSENKHQALFKYPVVGSNPDWMHLQPEISDKIKWIDVVTLPQKSQLCITRTGQLRFIQFKPEMAGTYAVFKNVGTTYPKGSIESLVLQLLGATYHHVDFVYDSLEYFDRVPVRERLPPLSPKVTPARMFSSEPNLRYQYRSLPEPLQAVPMEALIPNSTANGALPKFRYPKNVFKDLNINMMWAPPPNLQEFSSWSPACGTKITRMRFMRCVIDLDLSKMEKRLRLFKDSYKLQWDYLANTRHFEYRKGDGLAMLYLLHVLAMRLKVQLLDEARETTGRRPLYSAGLRWTEKGTDRMGTVVLYKLRIPCHYTLLHHLPNKTVGAEGRASLEVTKIQNTGEREQGVRLCGLADPLELLRMMGQVLVAQLKRLVNMIRRRPVVPQRSVVTSGKTLYMKCPVDLVTFERPACNLVDKEDNILWTLNGKSMRFFSASVERGPSLTDECALTVKNIQLNDAGEYVCYRTLLGSHSVEDKPAYRHFVEVVRPEFDPPPVEEVYFGMTMCIVWNAFMVLLWSLVSIVRSFLSLLGREPEGPNQPEVWTSFFDDDPTLGDINDEEDSDKTDSDEDDDDDDESLEDLEMSELSDNFEKDKKKSEESESKTQAKSKRNKEQHNSSRWRRVRTWVKKKKD
uniref:Ig-like domain-containing protein n=1 Tax=Macrostomum lignano TaxID=282301 RepID=A0A1I8JHG9_9PLAT